MSSRQFTPFGGSGEIVTLDNINEYDDLPPLAEIDSPDVYEIRTGNFATDYLVPMQDGSTDFNEWYSLVDGQIILNIPDREIDYFEWGGPVSDRYSDWINGSTDDWEINQDAPVWEGDYSLKMTGSVSTHLVSEPGDGLSYYPEPGDAVEGYVRDDSNNAACWIFVGVDADAKDGYAVRVHFRDDSFEIWKLVDDSFSQLASESFSFGNQFYATRIDWDYDSEHNLRARLWEANDYEGNEASPPTAEIDLTVSDNDVSEDNRGIAYRQDASEGGGDFTGVWDKVSAGTGAAEFD